MNITDVRVRKVIIPDSKICGYASVTIDGAIAIHDIKVINGQNGLFIAMPSRKDKENNEYKDIVHPINSETRAALQDAILDEYNRQD